MFTKPGVFDRFFFFVNRKTGKVRSPVMVIDFCLLFRYPYSQYKL